MTNHHPLRRWRFERDMSMKELADKLGCGSSYISEIESRRKLPSTKLAREIAVVTGLSLDDIIGLPDEAKNPEGSDAVSI